MIKALSPGESEQEIDRLCMQNYFGGQLPWGLAIYESTEQRGKDEDGSSDHHKVPLPETAG